jgi:hypothetical protein
MEAGRASPATPGGAAPKKKAAFTHAALESLVRDARTTGYSSLSLAPLPLPFWASLPSTRSRSSLPALK